MQEIFETMPFRGGVQVPTGGLMPSSKLEYGSTPRISVTSMNNAIVGYYKDVNSKNYRTYENCISVSFLGTVFYHPYKASFDMKVHCLKPVNHELRCGEALFLVTSIQKLVKNNTYGNQTSSTDLPYMKVILPVNDNNELDWDYMQERITELEKYLTVTGLNDYTLTEQDIKILSNNNKKHKNFQYNDLFKLQKIKNKLSKEVLSKTGIYPVYSSDSENNGIIGYTDNPEFKCTKENPIYLVFGDHTRTMNIACKSFSVTDNTKVLIPNNNNIKSLLYIITVWKKQIPNLGYARHWKIANNCFINLPVRTDSSVPDFDFMEKYIKAIEKVVIVDVIKYKDEMIQKTKDVVNKDI